MRGVNTEDPAHLNIHKWLDPQSCHHNKVLTDAIFHYSAQANKGERFEVCIATSEMHEAA